ncbi:N-acetylneuraminate synthase [Candidatus Sumerlaeota bacterium]|nr:N-acetylneuraminate synthase [Candidatus Sumerlaeota bacterium]
MNASVLDLKNLNRCFIIAEAGVNHNGDVETAKRLVDAAKKAGADAVKFQTFQSEKLVNKSAKQAEYQAANTGKAESQYDMLKRLEFSEAAHREILAYCSQCAITFMSTPFHAEAADFLDELGVPAFKLGSGEVTNLPFLAHVARKGRPIMLSTGMANLGEVEDAVRTIEQNGNPQLALLHCVSNYPANPADANLRAMETLTRAFGRPVGYSDHVPSNAVAFAAVALGARIIEKHLTLDRNMPGPDHQASLEPAQFAELTAGVRQVESALGDGIKRPAASERNTAEVARKSLVAAHDIAAGAVLQAGDLAIKRPGSGIPPRDMQYVLGRRTNTALSEGDLIRLEDLT